MASPSKSAEFDEGRRSSARIPLAIPIILSGADSAGKSFIEKTQTLVINRRGAKILSKHSVAPGGLLQVAIPHLNRETSATVVWLEEKQGGGYEVAIDLKRPGDFWGIQFPGETGGARAGEEREPRAEAPVERPVEAPSRASALASEAPVVQAPETPPVASPPGSDDPSALEGRLAGRAFQENLAEVLEQFGKQAEESLKRLQGEALHHTRDILRRAVESTGEQLEKRAIEIMARNQMAWEQTLQGLARKVEERLAVRLAEYEMRLSKTAEQARQDMARRLGELGDVFRK